MAFALALFSCQDRDYNTSINAKLQFSTDTLSFDTVFTTVGSTTLHFKVFNPYKQDLEINSIALQGGAASNFRINIDGAPELAVTDKLLRKRDSMYIFVDVNVNPNEENIPFVIEDYVVFNTNGKEQKLLLQAYGQNAHHFDLQRWKGDIGFQTSNEFPLDTTYFLLIENDTVLKAGKPYYLHENLLITEGVELKLEAGVEFYIHKDKSIYVQGSLKSLGTQDAPIVFRGDRLDDIYPGRDYDKVPGQWGAIGLLQSSYDNTFEYTHIRNGLIGIHVDSLAENKQAKVVLKNCRIENMTYASIFARNGSIVADNCLFSNSDNYLLAASGGGQYDFTNCTFANYYNWTSSRKDASVLLTNYYIEKNTIYAVDLQRANFTNCIIDGELNNELMLSYEDSEGNDIPAAFNYHFDHCMLRVDYAETDTNAVSFVETLWNKKALFFEPREAWDFHIDTLSAAIDAGIATHLNADIDDVLYDGLPDIGAYEFVGAKPEEE